MSQLFDLPARKVFIRDLVGCCRVSLDLQNIRGKKHKEWRVQNYGREFRVDAVWIQGVAVEVNDVDGFIILDDGTGKAKIIGHNKLPFLSVKLHQGQYIMGVCRLVNAGECPNLKAIKIHTLSDEETLKKLWPLEVMDQILHV